MVAQLAAPTQPDSAAERTAPAPPPRALPSWVAGRDRVIDLVRAVAMVAVALGHFLVTDVVRAGDGGLQLRDSLAALPAVQGLTWVFQVMPLFFFAGGAVGFVSWRRHSAAGGSPGSWIAARLWRLAWPTVPVVATWVAVTQFGDRVLGLDPALLAASRSVALVVWFLAVYAVVMALVPLFDAALARLGWVMPAGMLAAAAVVDAVVATSGFRTWTLVNYVLVWGAVTSWGWWWPAAPRARDVRRGALLAAGSFTTLVALTATGAYPLSMVGVAGATRTNSWPPTVALAVLGAMQVGLLLAARPRLARWLDDDRRYRVAGLLGARAMTIYLWHSVAPAMLSLALVLPGLWPTSPPGSPAWWALRGAWMVLAVVLAVPIVLAVGRFERAPAITPTASTLRAVAAAVALAVAWGAMALQGLYVQTMPLGLPWWTLGGLVAGAVLVRSRLGPGRLLEE